MKSLMDSYTLVNGVRIPCVGFGTWQTPDGDTAISSVKEAIKLGYRHIDTAMIYHNEEGVGRGIIESGIKREDLFITTKVWGDDRGYEETKVAFNLSCEKLQVDYLDLYLIHWPSPLAFRERASEVTSETWRAMEDLYKSGKIRAIGVSNFMVHHLEDLKKTATIIPHVNQIRLFPGFMWQDTVNYCRENNILLEAYSPFGTGKIFDSIALKEVAKKYSKTIAQICLRWSLQMNFLPLPKSITPERIKENTDIFDFELSSEEINHLTNIENICGNGTHPDEAPF